MSNDEQEVKKVFGHLKKEVPSELCVTCGACVSACPLGSLEIEEGSPALKGQCTACGLCYAQCPQIVTDEEIQTRIFGSEPRDSVGHYEKAYSAQARSSDIKVKAQDGGVVTALLSALLETGFIDGAIVMGIGDEPWKPEPRIITSQKELLECAGTKYSSAPTLTKLRETIDYYSLEELVLVGTPCQIKAYRQMSTGEKSVPRITSSIKLTIGLFCMESFSYEGFFKKVIEDQLDLSLSEIAKFDVQRGNFVIYREGKPKRELGIDGLAQFSFTSCRICSDFTSELADISIGSVGTPSGYSTVLLRTEIGEQAFNQALRVDRLETESLNDDGPELEILRKVADKKKNNAEREIQIRRKKDQSLPPRLKEKD
ncbi:MAG: Coenzyme F420 hydrogenase/dehydrogenase, beta subunit C-terminal domain [Hadesarchaea archaeon]|nr:Coenzyme F420 hydrogenase/dehydrogenase, beta subunit C-terminal domain [Hadesarchaea archaeon]